MVADAELTGIWEKALEQIEWRTLDPESFMLSIREYTGKVTGEILRLKFPEPSSCVLACPKCKTGNVVVKSKVAKCDREGCGPASRTAFLFRLHPADQGLQGQERGTFRRDGHL